MAILTETKQQLDEQFGPGKEANIPLGGEELFKVQEAFGYTLGRYNVTVGFYGGVARYASFAKDRLDDQNFLEQDTDVCLALIAPPPLAWETVGENSGDVGPTISDHQITLKDALGKGVEILACYRRTRPYLFAYIPAAPEVAGSALDGLLAEMNGAATMEKKVDAIIAVVNELAARIGK